MNDKTVNDILNNLVTSKDKVFEQTKSLDCDSNRFFIIPWGDFDFFVADSKNEIYPFVISDVEFNHVILWFALIRDIPKDLSVKKITISEDETLYVAHMKSKDFEYGFTISALNRHHLYEILNFLYKHQ